jgi:hypothetical protein
MTYDIGNLDPGLGQAQQYGRVKLVNGISIPKAIDLEPLDHRGPIIFL